jgi:hypothetical protein
MTLTLCPPDPAALLALHRSEAIRLLAEARRSLRYVARADCDRTRVNAAREAAELAQMERRLSVLFGVLPSC